MNNWKCAITLATCCCACLRMVPSAPADFVGVTSVFPDDPDTVLLCTEAHGGFVPGPLTVCDVFAVFDDPADRLLAVGNADLQVFNGVIPDIFYQHPAGGNSPRSPCCSCIEPRFFGFPDLICDSFITIGLKCGPGAPNTDGTTPDDDFVLIEFLQNGHVVGGWFNEDLPNGQGDAGNYPDLQVLFLQSSVEVGLSMSGVIDVFWKNAVGDTILEVGIPVECAAECGSCPTDTDGDGNTDAADLAVLLGSWGSVDAGECLDADDNGLIDAFDLAVLLGAWGPCP